jgi:hypothetical protein
MAFTEQERVAFAQDQRELGATAETAMLAFRRTGCGYVEILHAVRVAYPDFTLFAARAFFETRFGLEVLRLSEPMLAVARIAFPPTVGDTRRLLVSFLLRGWSPLATAAHLSAAWAEPWRGWYQVARSAQPSDEKEAAVICDLLEANGFDWSSEEALLRPRVGPTGEPARP